jgi:LmbE family N-acetylglucosaminyl deacetylase
MKVLFLSPHTDDVELGCGATISKLIENGNEVFVAIFSICEKSLPKNYKRDTLKKESLNSLESLGIKSEHIDYFDYEVRVFDRKRQEILDDLIILKNKISPDMIFIPSIDDYHQDHKTIAEESVRCFKNNCSILSYELIWNNTGFKNQMYFEISEKNLNDKIKSLSHYKSQVKRKYMSSDFIRSLAIVRGIQNGIELAEAFEVVRFKYK